MRRLALALLSALLVAAPAAQPAADERDQSMEWRDLRNAEGSFGYPTAGVRFAF